MRQYRITSQDILSNDADDCYLSPEDPIHELKKVSMVGGIGSEAAMGKYLAGNLPVIQSDNRAQLQREQNIQPGTEDWFKLWFGRKAK